MGNSSVAGLQDLLQLFEEELSLADINSAKYLGKISAAIVKRRMELEMTQKDFAKYLGVSQGMVSKWEGGDYNFTIKTLAEIAEKLELEMYVNLKKYNEVTSNVYFENVDYACMASGKKSFVGKTGNIISFCAKASRVYNAKIDNDRVYGYRETIEM